MTGAIAAFLTGILEVLCLIAGAGLPDAEASRHVWWLWRAALVSIPLTGLFTVTLPRLQPWLRQPSVRLSARSAAWALAIYWCIQSIASKVNGSGVAGGEVAAMAAIPALMLALRLMGQSGRVASS